jgi:3-oxoacyl-[acyl-carrier-protein] synthase-3
LKYVLTHADPGGEAVGVDQNVDLYLAALGVHLPERMVSTRQAVAAGWYDADDLEEAGLTGLPEAGTRAAPDMAVRAAGQCLKRAAADAGDIDLLVHASAFPQGPEMWSPHAYVLRELGGGDVSALEVRQGCNGMFAALEVAAALLRADPRRTTALLTAADNLGSPLVDRWRSGGPAFILGDAACALLLTKQPGFARLAALRSTTVPELEGMHRGAEPLYPPGATSGRAIDLADRAVHFGRHTMPLAEATAIVADRQACTARAALADAGLRPDDVAVVVHANAARWLAELWMAALGLPMSRSAWDVGRTVGHVGSSDQIVGLDRLLTGGRLRQGDHVLLMGSAPGFSIAAAVLQLTEEAPWLPPSRSLA